CRRAATAAWTPPGESRSRARRHDGARRLRLVPRAHPLSALKRKAISAGAVLGGEGREHECGVVPERPARDDVSGKPARASVQDGQAPRARMPLAARELVDVVAGLAA